MPTKLFTAKYYDTYYLANIVQRVAFDRLTHARDMEGFYEGSGIAFVKPFPAKSAFHHFIEYIVSFVLRDRTLAVNPADLLEEERLFDPAPLDCRPDCRRFPINDAFDVHGFEHQSFVEWLSEQGKTFEQSDEDDVYEYCDDLLLAGPWEDLVTQISQEVFFILFLNRRILQAFNEEMASELSAVRILDLEEPDREWLRKDGVLKRVSPPTWASTAVFHRDRGLCALCFRDLTGLINVSGDPHCDHIVPLAQGGLNDVTNLQLLCKECNLKKRSKRVESSEMYERWY
jgi:hypothetical protein